MTPTYSPLARAAFPSVLRLDADVFPHAWLYPDFHRELAERPNCETTCVIATTRAVVVGYALLRDYRDRTEVLRLAVDPMHRRKGIGSEFLRLAEARMVGGRCREGVWVPVPESNREAIGFALNRGYRGEGVMRGHFGTDDAYVFNGPTCKLLGERVRTREGMVVA